MHRGVFILLLTVASASGVALKPAAKDIVSATDELFTVDNVEKSILLLAGQNSQWNSIIKSLDPITPDCYNCLFNNFRSLSIKVQEKQINESDVPKYMTAACGKYYSQLTQLQSVSQAAIVPYVQSIQVAYTNLTQNVKNVLGQIQQLGEDVKANPELQNDKTAYCARVQDITNSVNNLNDEDRQSVVAAYPPSADYILTTGSHYSDFVNYLNLTNVRCAGELTSDEKDELTKLSLQYHQEYRDNLVPGIHNLTTLLENATPSANVTGDPVIVRVATKIANAVVADYKARKNSNYFKKQLNQAVQKSNKLNKVATNNS
ncbi:hypothetical protein FO519_004896 [Halicephalobus sp. NKZ332]|nr:hypothetical protein FO519_004896 [Halicephalobus sp. NKZ332]